MSNMEMHDSKRSAASAEICAHCGKNGKPGVGFKRCSRCKQASYCGAECQSANWKRHKKTCATLQVVHASVIEAFEASNWRGMLKWEGRLEELVGGQPDAPSERILLAFSVAHKGEWNSTGSNDHARAIVSLQERRIPLLGNLQLFRDLGDSMCVTGEMLLILVRNSEAATWFERARDVGARHGFFSVECKACSGLGRLALKDDGRHEEGVELLRNSLAAAQLNEYTAPQESLGKVFSDDTNMELEALDALIGALFTTHALEEVDPLVLRYREAAKARSEKEGVPCYAAYSSLFYSARLHEVLCLCTPRLGTPHHSSVIASSTAI